MGFKARFFWKPTVKKIGYLSLLLSMWGVCKHIIHEFNLNFFNIFQNIGFLVAVSYCEVDFLLIRSDIFKWGLKVKFVEKYHLYFVEVSFKVMKNISRILKKILKLMLTKISWKWHSNLYFQGVAIQGRTFYVNSTLVIFMNFDIKNSLLARFAKNEF